MKKVFKIPLYFGELILIQEKDLSKIIKEYDLVDVADYNGLAFEAPVNNYARYVLAVNNNVTPKIIAHESLHIVNFICKHRGIYHDTNNDEPQAYLLGWIVEKCHKHFKIKK